MKLTKSAFHIGTNNQGTQNTMTVLDDEEHSDELRADATTSHHSPVGRRDEVVEVRKMSSKDTKRLRLWRLVVTSVLLLTAFVITFTTYRLLEQQEDSNFQTAVSFSTSSNRSFSFPGHSELTNHFRCSSSCVCV